MSQYSNAQIRNLMTDVFEDEEDFEFFVEDHFAEVINQFEEGDSFKRKAQTLAKYCQGQDLTDKLILLISRDFPDKFKESGLPEPEVERETAEESPPSKQLAEPDKEETVDKPDEASTPQPSTTPVSEDEPSEKPQNPEVFISYSRRDETFIKQLYQKLTHKGISAWYDRANIEAGTLWRESIVNGITSSKIFLLVLSPDSMKSDPVRREISLAQGEDKIILPIMWRKTDFPQTVKYQLAGVQYIDFAETASEENFEKVIQAVNKLLNNVTVEEVTSGEPVIAQEIASVPSANKAATSAKKRQLFAVQATRRSIVSRLITPMQLDAETRERYNDELGWLFTAADHLLQIRRKDVTPDSKVPTEIPATAEGNGTNSLKSDIDDFSLQLAEGQVTSIIKQTNIYIRNLNIELRKLAQVGGEDQASVALLNSIYSQRKAIVERIQELTELMSDFYGVRIRAPEELLDELEAQQLGY